MPQPVLVSTDLRVGDYYENCSYYPCLCTCVQDDEVRGASLIDGGFPIICSIEHCQLRKLTLYEAMHWKLYGPLDLYVRGEKWWDNIKKQPRKAWRPRHGIPPETLGADDKAFRFLRELAEVGYFDTDDFRGTRTVREAVNNWFGFSVRSDRKVDLINGLVGKGWITFRYNDDDMDFRDRLDYWRIDITPQGQEFVDRMSSRAGQQ